VGKQQQLSELAKRRQTDRLPPHKNLSEICNGCYECEYVSPWTISANNLDAETMLIGQDWASADVLERESNQKRQERRRLGQDFHSTTNTNLRHFLDLIGLTFSDTYATNIFPFIKSGAKNARIGRADFAYCSEQYAIPQIEIIAPKRVVCLGKKVLRAILLTSQERAEVCDLQALPGPFGRIGSTLIFAVPHPGRLGTSMAGGLESSANIWRKLAFSGLPVARISEA
jgi:uracil-DNA glycosylase